MLVDSNYNRKLEIFTFLDAITGYRLRAHDHVGLLSSLTIQQTCDQGPVKWDEIKVCESFLFCIITSKHHKLLFN